MRKEDCRFRCSKTTKTVMDYLSELLTEVALNKASVNMCELDAISDMIRAKGEAKDVHVTVINQKFEGASCSPKLEIAAGNPIAVYCSIEMRGASCDPSITVK